VCVRGGVAASGGGVARGKCVAREGRAGLCLRVSSVVAGAASSRALSVGGQAGARVWGMEVRLHGMCLLSRE